MKLNKFLLSMTVVGGIAAAQTLAPPGRNLTRRDGGSQVPDSTMTPPVSDSILPVVADSVAVQNAVNQAADSVDWDAVNWDSIYPSTMLGEVVVKAVKTAVIAKQDTMEYNAGSFKTATNANVEDLLKKLPGVEVGSDGSISSGGKTVTKILVDGKEFFGDDPTAATKNLPSDMIDKVQVVNRKSDLARLTGVDDGEEETVINLTVKKNMKNGWFGNAEAGYGTDGRYRYSFNVNRFQDGNQITILGGGNNVNQMGFADRGRGRFGSFGGNNGINSTQNIGINFNVGKGDRIRVGGNVVYSHSDRKTYEDRFTEYLDSSDSSSYQNSWQSTRDRGHNVYADFRLQWKIDSANTVDFRPRFVFSHRDMQRSDTSMLRAGDFDRTPVNRQENDIHTKGNSYDVSGNLIFNHNFLSHPGRSLSVQAKYSFSDQKDYQFSWAKLLYYLKQDDSEDLFRYVNNETWSSQVSGRVTWTEPLGDVKRGNFLTVAYNLDYRWNNADRITYSLDPTLFPGYLPEPSDGSPDGAVMDESLSNRFRNKYFNQELQVGYKKVARKYNLQAGITFTPSSMSSTDLIDDAKNIPTRWVYNFAPFLRLQWKFDKSSSLRINYRARTSQPSMSKLQPVADISDPMNITIGNPDLKPSFSQSIMAHYNGFDTDAQRSIFAMVNASMISNNVVSKTVTDPTTGGRTTTYENMNGDATLPQPQLAFLRPSDDPLFILRRIYQRDAQPQRQLQHRSRGIADVYPRPLPALGRAAILLSAHHRHPRIAGQPLHQLLRFRRLRSALSPLRPRTHHRPIYVAHNGLRQRIRQQPVALERPVVLLVPPQQAVDALTLRLRHPAAEEEHLPHRQPDKHRRRPHQRPHPLRHGDADMEVQLLRFAERHPED